MKRTTLAHNLARRLPFLTRKQARTAFRELFDTDGVIHEALRDGEVVKIRGLGSFRSDRIDSYITSHPLTGEVLVVPEHIRVHFKPSVTLRENLTREA